MPSSLNGTGVTFNDSTTLQSGSIPTANLGSGTANSSTFLRGDKTWATVPAAAPSTTDVLNATAGASAGAVGTYAFLGRTQAARNDPNSTVAGSGLRFIHARAQSSWNSDSPTSPVLGGTTISVSGTWRYMSGKNFDAQISAGVWLRIS